MEVISENGTGTTFTRIGYNRKLASAAARRSNIGDRGQTNNRSNIGSDGGSGTEGFNSGTETGTSANARSGDEDGNETRQFDSRFDGRTSNGRAAFDSPRIEFGSGTDERENEEFHRVVVNDETKPQTRRPRQPSSPIRRTKADNISDDSVNAVIQMFFGGLCLFLGGHWELTDDEAKLLSAPSARILSRLPNGVGRKINDGIDPIMLCYILISIIAPRIQKSIELKKKHELFTTIAKTKPTTKNGTGTDVPIGETKLPL